MIAQSLIVTQLLLKRAEIEAQIQSFEDRLGQARAEGDCLVVMLTRTGSEVAAGTTVMEGVAVPDTDCPY